MDREYLEILEQIEALRERIVHVRSKHRRLTLPSTATAACITEHSSHSFTSTISRLIAAKVSSGRRKVYTDSLNHYLTRFAAGRGNVEDVTRSDIESFLSQYSGNTRATWLNRISTLFSYAVRQDIIPSNPCLKIERQRIDRKPPTILTPKQAVELWQICPTLCRPCFVLGLYAGLRPEEVMHVQWLDVHLDHETPTVRVNHSKTRLPRIVQLEPIAVKLLNEFPVKSGSIAPSNSTVRRFKRRARVVLDGQWSADILRHSFASYALALHRDAGIVSTQMGNSSAIMLKHYHTPVSSSDCTLFWAQRSSL